MTTTLCTLYNSLYLDKGLVLYDSLCECAIDFELYVLCMDDKCYEVLSDLKLHKLKPLSLSVIENDKMKVAKSNRSMAEYCWTCSSRLIQYIIETYQPECCTYIDADMYFYHDPQILVDEMLEAGKSVMMVPHRFTERNNYLAKTVGTYCVEFNSFKNDEKGLRVLNHWHEKCLECCSNLGDGIHWGDQKYMDEWTSLFPEYVHVCKNPGAGVAPWNIELYKNFNSNHNAALYIKEDKLCSFVFYHFQSLVYLTENQINTGIPHNNKFIDYGMVDVLYFDYLTKIKIKKMMLKEKYNIFFYIKAHPSAISKITSVKDILVQIYDSIHKFLFPKKKYIITLC